jgi:Predicted membrane protein (DUF2142)
VSDVPTRGRESSQSPASLHGFTPEPEQAAQATVIRTRRRPALTIWATVKRVPAAAWMCVLIALLNAGAWSLITPPFQGRDEVDHFAYVSQLVEAETLPANGHSEGVYSPEETLVLEALHYYQVRFTPRTPTISSSAEQRTLEEALHANASLKGSGEAGIATAEPPLYYALQTIPYIIGRGNVLVQLQLMRLFGMLLGGLTTLLVFLFLRETLPSAPWAATIGALCVALQPLFAFMSGSVNPDTLLFTISAAVFLCLARAFHRGFTWRPAVLLGLLVVAGLLTKLNFIGIALGIAFGVIALTVRELRSRGRAALVLPAITGSIAIIPVLLYILRNALSNRPTFGAASGVLHTITVKSLFHEFSYIWELYLPRLPGMTHYFAGIATYKDIWFDRSVGLYGWMDTMFPRWVENVALIPAAAVALLCARELLRQRAALRARLPEFGAYAAITLGVLAMLGVSSYASDAVQHAYAFGEPRYLLPMLPLFGAVIALAIRGAGRRWAPVAGAALVVLLLAHDIFSQLQLIARYYG